MRTIIIFVLFCAASFSLSAQAQQNITMTLTASPNPANLTNYPIQITVKMTPTPSGIGCCVTIFVDGPPTIGDIALIGSADVVAELFLSVGSHTLQATYSDQNGSSTSPVFTEVVTAQPVSMITSVLNAGTGWPTAGSPASNGTFLGVTSTAATNIPLPYTLGGASVFVDGVRAPLYYASASQINFKVPWEVVDNDATISVTNGVWNVTRTNTVLAPV